MKWLNRILKIRQIKKNFSVSKIEISKENDYYTFTIKPNLGCNISLSSELLEDKTYNFTDYINLQLVKLTKRWAAKEYLSRTTLEYKDFAKFLAMHRVKTQKEIELEEWAKQHNEKEEKEYWDEQIIKDKQNAD